MNQPLYIAPDEEIISVIARLRKLPDSDVTLVFPKHSVVTQSIINLKLLAREGEKLQKKLTLVSQNENARALAEKIGFATLPYTQEIEKGSLYVQGEVSIPAPTPTASPSFLPESDPANAAQFLADEKSASLRPKSTQIGSQSFYNGQAPDTFSITPPLETESQTATPFAISGESRNLGDIRNEMRVAPASPTPSPTPTQTPVPLRVRNMSPERAPSLNSMRDSEPMSPKDLSRQSTVSTAIFPDSYPSAGVNIPASPLPPTAPLTPNTQPTAIHDFFNRKESFQEAPVRMPKSTPSFTPVPTFAKKEAVPKKAKSPVMVTGTVSSKLTMALIGLVALLVIASGALGFFLVFPTATVAITPQSITDSYDQSYTLNANTGSDEVPLEKKTEELTVNIAGIASGASGTPAQSGSRAEGILKITNNYSNEPQPLVATTRFESASGKIYRIQENITVPGNGSVEAKVISDGSGESYNLNEGTLTIPGFKGSDKFEKMSATVSKAIVGGGGGESTASGTFIRADEETLRQRAAEEAKRMFSENIDNTKADTYTFTDGLVVERVTESNMPKVGSVPGEYEYSAVFKVTAYTTSQKKVTESMLKNIRSEYDGIQFAPATQELSFTDFSLNDKGDQASLKAHLDTNLKAILNEETIKKDLAGKSASELENFTREHPEVKNLSISFHPAWALKQIPANTEKIKLVTE